MPKKQEVTPNFRMSYASLAQLADAAVVLINRDSAELANYGIDATWIAGLETKTEDFKDLRTDEEYLIDVSVAVEDKNAERASIETRLRGIRIRAENIYKSSAKARRFAYGDLSRFKDADLYRLAKRFIRNATLYLTDLQAKGLTQQDIDDLTTETASFDDKIDDVEKYIADRDEATEDRIEAGNEIYALITELFDYGKDYWRERDEAKYNDYIIYRRDTAEPEPEPVTGEVEAGATVVVIEGGYEENTDFELKNTGSVPLVFCRGEEGGVPCPGPNVEVPPGATVVKQASELGALGKYIKVTNSSTQTGSFEVKQL